MRHWLLAAGAAALVAQAATADVKGGVDAWAHGNFKKAVEQWRGAAAAGDPDAEFNLGQAYKLGRGVPVDPAMAQNWFRKAALQGHQQAEDNYGLSLYEDQRLFEAAPWLEKSAARDERRADLVLGIMLFNGDGGLSRDYARAYALVTRASQQGLASASETLAQMDRYLSPADRAKGIALARQYTARGPSREPDAQAVVAAVVPPGPTVAALAQPEAGKPKPIAASAPKPVVAAAKPGIPDAPKPAPAVASGWKAQLGAFRDRGNAEALWARVQGKLGGAAPSYPRSNGLTRLVATGFASKTAAQAACARAGANCIVIAP